MHPADLSSKLPGLVREAWARARASGALLYYPTQVAIVPVGSIPFQLRYSPALASKPKNPQPKDSSSSKPFNPFENPDPALVVVSSSANGKAEDEATAQEVVDGIVGPHHNLVLNKFAIVAEHFLVITRAVEPQTHVLGMADLAAAHGCIKAYEGSGGGLFAFFNSGPHSGASQPHRHLQLLPVERMREGISPDEEEEWSPLIDRLLQLQSSSSSSSSSEEASSPFAVFAAFISGSMSHEELHKTYLGLYRRAVMAASAAAEGGVGNIDDAEDILPSTGESRISYNLAMTSTTMAVCPRTAEGGEIIVSSSSSSSSARGEEGEKKKEKIGYAGLNGTVLGGTALVKSQAEWEALKEEPELLREVLGRIGVGVGVGAGGRSPSGNL